MPLNEVWMCCYDYVWCRKITEVRTHIEAAEIYTTSSTTTRISHFSGPKQTKTRGTITHTNHNQNRKHITHISRNQNHEQTN
jgi:hypothetical protein